MRVRLVHVRRQYLGADDSPKEPEVHRPAAIQYDDLLTSCGGDAAFARLLLKKFQDRLTEEKEKLSQALVRAHIQRRNPLLSQMASR